MSVIAMSYYEKKRNCFKLSVTRKVILYFGDIITIA